VVVLASLLSVAQGIVVRRSDQHQVISAAPNDAPADVLEFVDGIILGMQTSFSGNLTLCVDDETTVMSEFAKGFKLIQQGLDNWSAGDVEAGINQIGYGVIELRAVFQDCGLNATLADLDHIATLLQGGVFGVVEFIASEVLNILEHRVTLGTYLRLAVKAYDAGEYKASGYNVGRFLAILIEDYPINNNEVR